MLLKFKQIVEEIICCLNQTNYCQYTDKQLMIHHYQQQQQQQHLLLN